MINVDEVFNAIKAINLKNKTRDEVINILLKGFSYNEIDDALTKLQEQGKIFIDAKNRLLFPSDVGLILCKISGTKKHFAFAQVVGDENNTEYFIPSNQLMGAMHGDLVYVQITESSDDKNSVARVVRVVKRNNEKLVGTLQAFNGKFTVVTDDDRFEPILIPRSGVMGCINGDKVVVQIDYDKSSDVKKVGRIVECLGRSGDIKVEQLAIIRSFNLREEFPQDVLNEAKRLPQSIQESLVKNRVDFRNLRVITIDGEDTRDIDDAISIEKLKNGYRIGVHIADVSNYVTESSALDKEAFLRGTSVYFPNQVIPMLPRELSNGICSLNQGVNRFTLSCLIDIDEDCNVKNSKIVEGVIKSLHRMTYTDVQKIINGNTKNLDEFSDVFDDIVLFNNISQKLKEKRQKRGEITFNIPEPIITENELGEIVSIEKRVQDESHELIESLMILCNEVIAETFFKLHIPFVYRVHEKPDSIKLDGFLRFVNSQKILTDIDPENATPMDFQSLLKSMENDPRKDAIEKITLRSMMKARYSPNCLGHFGLASTFYCHFTSPIRRYPDLMIHRIIKKYLHGTNLDVLKSVYTPIVNSTSDQASSTEKIATEAERTVDDYKKALYMSNFIGQDFEGSVSGVTDFGVFVELDNTCEGLIRSVDLPYDNYIYDKDAMKIYGTKFHYQLGDKIKIVVKSTDIKSRTIDFELLGYNNIDGKIPIIRTKEENKKNKFIESFSKSKLQEKNKKRSSNKKNKIKKSIKKIKN